MVIVNMKIDNEIDELLNKKIPEVVDKLRGFLTNIIVIMEIKNQYYTHMYFK